MTTFTQFAARCKMRHDFSDRIQVRYYHSDGQSFDTWVSGEEVTSRMRSEEVEQRLQRLSRLNREELKDIGKDLPREGKRRLQKHLRDRLADSTEDFLGENLIGSNLADAVRGHEEGEADPDKERWQAYLQDDSFRAFVLELAWVNLRGSFPDEEDITEFDDWV